MEKNNNQKISTEPQRNDSDIEKEQKDSTNM